MVWGWVAGPVVVLLAVLGTISTGMGFRVARVKSETLLHTRGGVENLHSERGQGAVSDSTELTPWCLSPCRSKSTVGGTHRRVARHAARIKQHPQEGLFAVTVLRG